MSTKYKIIDSLKVPHTKDLTILVQWICKLRPPLEILSVYGVL